MFTELVASRSTSPKVVIDIAAFFFAEPYVAKQQRSEEGHPQSCADGFVRRSVVAGEINQKPSTDRESGDVVERGGHISNTQGAENWIVILGIKFSERQDVQHQYSPQRIAEDPAQTAVFIAIRVKENKGSTNQQGACPAPNLISPVSHSLTVAGSAA